MRAKCENAGSAPIGSHPPGRAQVHQVCVRIVRSATGNTTFPTSIFMTITLQSLRIERFKRIHDAVFDLGTWNVLVGANNSGKSSIIQGLHFAVAVFQSIGLLEKFPQSSDKPLSMSLGPNQLIYSPSDDPYSLGPDGRLRELRRSFKTPASRSGGCRSHPFPSPSRRERNAASAFGEGRNRNLVVTVENPQTAKRLIKPLTLELALSGGYKSVKQPLPFPSPIHDGRGMQPPRSERP